MKQNPHAMNQNDNNSNENPDDTTQFCNPGVFSVEFLKQNKAFFKGVSNVLYYTGDFIYRLARGRCENKELLKDYQKYGPEAFKFDFVVFGPEYVDPEKLKQALKQAKSEWEGPLY